MNLFHYLDDVGGFIFSRICYAGALFLVVAGVATDPEEDGKGELLSEVAHVLSSLEE